MFECEKLYIKAKSKGAHHIINTKENLQNLVIEREPKRFTNREGKEIVYHDIRNYDTRNIVQEVESRLRTNYQQLPSTVMSNDLGKLELVENILTPLIITAVSSSKSMKKPPILVVLKQSLVLGTRRL